VALATAFQQVKMRGGFTLIELSIVLVIIGLLVGGVLVGKDLIKASEIRAQITQIEKFNAAANTFRIKYNALPGDIKESEAYGFGLFRVSCSYVGYVGYGDNNGVITAGNGATMAAPIRCNLLGEPFMFFRQLSDANLIEGKYGMGLNCGAESGVISASGVGAFLPSAKIGTNGYIEANSPGDKKNYFILTTVNGFVGAGGISVGNNPITANEAYQIDLKTDNGLPGTGNIIAIDGSQDLGAFATWNTVSSVTGCVSAGAYALDPGTTQSCSLRFKFQ
jgi:prepilin-type N-terminal cleavage/methylation domain-containing protein